MWIILRNPLAWNRNKIRRKMAKHAQRALDRKNIRQAL